MWATGAKNWPTPPRRRCASWCSCSSYVGSSNEPAITLAERLVGLAANGLEAVFFTSGGAEANETAFEDRALLLEGVRQAGPGEG